MRHAFAEFIKPLEVLTVSTHGRGDLVSGSVKVVADGPLVAPVLGRERIGRTDWEEA